MTEPARIDLGEVARFVATSIGDADVFDMQGDDLYAHFAQVVVEDLLQRPDLLAALAAASEESP